MTATSGSLARGTWRYAATDGVRRGEVALPAPPVFDGMAAARGRLFVSLKDGTVQCFGE